MGVNKNHGRNTPFLYRIREYIEIILRARAESESLSHGLQGGELHTCALTLLVAACAHMRRVIKADLWKNIHFTAVGMFSLLIHILETLLRY